MLCKKILEEAKKCTENRANESIERELTNATEVKATKHKVKDKLNLQKQIDNKDNKASRIRKYLDFESLCEKAMETTPTNDATFTFDKIVLLWCKKVEEMNKVTFWVTFDKMEYKQTFCLAH